MSDKNDLGLAPSTKTTIKTESPTKASKELQELMRLHALAENLPPAIVAPVQRPAVKKAAAPTSAPAASSAPQTPQMPPTAPQPQPMAGNPPPDTSRLFFTGRLVVGKDYCANAAGCKVFGFADPLYFLANYFFGEQPKDRTRAFLQAVGTWGRGEYDPETAPLTTDRANFIVMIRRLGQGFPEELCVDWESFGKNPNIWLEAAIRRVVEWQKSNPGKRVALTNVRFKNEMDALKELGWGHWHVQCSPATWKARLGERNFTTASPEVNHPSEKFAAGIDSLITRLLSRPERKKLRVIWSDPAPMRSPQLYSVAEFLQELAINEATTEPVAEVKIDL